ncbi:MAG: hypothetical protein GKR88_16550 [Flavobacteriaceae bacterium]|nr:MAG: hypothetical protein GKR88_16550 [Flavobacteriaceae bacterium]
MKHKEYNNIVTSNGNSFAQKKLYNGKELQDELGLDWFDYGARNYDPSIGRWINIDPLASNYYTMSPYTYVLNNLINYTDPDGRYVRGDKTTKLSKFMQYFRLWEVEAIKYRKSFYGKWTTHVEPVNDAKIRVFDHDFRATEQIINKVGKNEKFSYNKAFGKYLDVGLPLDVAHFFKMAELAKSYPDFAVRMAYINEEYNQLENENPKGRTSAFSPEDLFSNELGVIFGSSIGTHDNMGDFLEEFFNEVKTLFTTNELKDGKYLKESNIKKLRSLAKKYYGTTDLREFTKDKDIYKLENIKKINNNAAKKNLPFYDFGND